MLSLDTEGRPEKTPPALVRSVAIREAVTEQEIKDWLDELVKAIEEEFKEFEEVQATTSSENFHPG